MPSQIFQVVWARIPSAAAWRLILSHVEFSAATSAMEFNESSIQDGIDIVAGVGVLDVISLTSEVVGDNVEWTLTLQWTDGESHAEVEASVIQYLNGTDDGQAVYDSSSSFTASFTGDHTVQNWGATGGSGAGDSESPGSGAGGGEYASSVVSLTESQVVTVTIATGGAKGTTAGDQNGGEASGPTSFGSYVVANRGQAGQGADGGEGFGGTGGTGTVKYNGGDGGKNGTIAGGGGGSSGGPAGIGNAGESGNSGGDGGDAVDAHSGTGGDGTTGPGQQGTHPGGAPSGGGLNEDGADGSDGRVIVSWGDAVPPGSTPEWDEPETDVTIIASIPLPVIVSSAILIPPGIMPIVLPVISSAAEALPFSFGRSNPLPVVETTGEADALSLDATCDLDLTAITSDVTSASLSVTTGESTVALPVTEPGVDLAMTIDATVSLSLPVIGLQPESAATLFIDTRLTPDPIDLIVDTIPLTDAPGAISVDLPEVDPGVTAADLALQSVTRLTAEIEINPLLSVQFSRRQSLPLVSIGADVISFDVDVEAVELTLPITDSDVTVDALALSASASLPLAFIEPAVTVESLAPATPILLSPSSITVQPDVEPLEVESGEAELSIPAIVSLPVSGMMFRAAKSLVAAIIVSAPIVTSPDFAIGAAHLQPATTSVTVSVDDLNLSAHGEVSVAVPAIQANAIAVSLPISGHLGVSIPVISAPAGGVDCDAFSSPHALRTWTL